MHTPPLLETNTGTGHGPRRRTTRSGWSTQARSGSRGVAATSLGPAVSQPVQFHKLPPPPHPCSVLRPAAPATPPTRDGDTYQFTSVTLGSKLDITAPQTRALAAHLDAVGDLAFYKMCRGPDGRKHPRYSQAAYKLMKEQLPNGAEKMLEERHLAPLSQPADRGFHTWSISLPPLDRDRIIILETQPGPAAHPAWDWAFWSRIETLAE